MLTGATLAGIASTAAHAAYEESDFFVDKHDLEFILKQIKIAESHSDRIRTGQGDQLLCDDPNDNTWTCVPDAKLPWGLRTVDGSYNNIATKERKNWGAGLQQFPRLLEPDFKDAEPISFDFDGPGPVEAGTSTSYKQKKGFVWDSEPRIISNLIVDQSVDNPAAVATKNELAELGATEYDHDQDASTPNSVFLPNVAPDEGLSAPFNSWFTLFGQFFDHGLDMVSKGGNGTVVVPLTADDPLMARAGQTPFLMLTRATNLPGPDGVVGTEDDVQEHTNRTTPFVDQNQTYTSHPSHQVFLREYEMVDHDADTATPEVPVPTGKLLNDEGGEGLATWADVKAQAATMLGIELDDADVHNVPLVATDPYGRFVPGADGFPQLVVAGDAENSLVEGDPVDPADATQAMKAGHAFLDDIGHNAVPTASVHGQTVALAPDTDSEYNPVHQPLAEAGTYDDEQLDAHFITGDGRGNENIGLSAVHHVFHSEHNRLTAQIEDVIATSGDEAWKAQWHDTSGPWDYGERIFQAARYVTEMEYQHLVFEEFARKIQPNIDVGPLNESLYHDDINPAVTAEFAHVVYRFGHSMLTDTVARDGYEGRGVDDVPLLDAFLNPAQFAPGDLTHDEGAAAIIQGMMNQTGNGIDEFVVDTLRNNLLGLPLDLATINMARARDAGVPSLQEARRTFYAATSDPAVKPYENWLDFMLSMKHRASIVNFIAAYGTDPSITSIAPTEADFIAKRRQAAQVIVDTLQTPYPHELLTAPAAESGLDDVDFWVGGLAENPQIFGGMLGPTFDAVFEEHLENLQNADRFYYLNRNQGLNLFHQLEANSFAELVMRNTDAKNVPVDLFARQDESIDLGNLGSPLPAGLVRLNGWWRWDGKEHVTIHGTDIADKIRGGAGDDALWSHGGDDTVEGGDGVDGIHGGTGNDIITDEHGDDVIHAGPGDDAINGGPGLDILFGQSGQDFVMHGQDATRSFAGAGDDFVMGGDAGDVLGADQGTDWVEGGKGADLLQGDLALTFQNDLYGGPDVLIGGSGNDDHDAEGGDDVMTNNGRDRHAGMLGFDWVTHKGNPDPVDADMNVRVFQPLPVQTMRSLYMNIEGLSGWQGDDVLRARSQPGDQALINGTGHELTQEHLDRVAGLRDLLGGGNDPAFAAPFMGDTTAAEQEANDIVLGGAGNDLIEGRGGDDFVDGDAALDIYIEGPGGERGESMDHFRSRIFDGTILPSQLTPKRAIINQGVDSEIDTVFYDDDRLNFSIEEVAGTPGVWQVTNLAPQAEDLGVDTLRNVERLQFGNDLIVNLVDLSEEAAVGSLTVDNPNPTEDQPLTATATVPDAIDPSTLSFTWQVSDGAGNWVATDSGVGETFTPGDAEAGKQLRVVATFNTVDGLQTITSDPTAAVQNVNDEPTGLVVSGEPAVGSMVTASGLTDADGPFDEEGNFSAELTYRWQQGSGDSFTDIPGADAPTLLVTGDQEQQQLRVVVSYADAHGTSETVTSEATSAVPDAPEPAQPSILAVTQSAPGTMLVQFMAPADGPLALTNLSLRVLDGAQEVKAVTDIAPNESQVEVGGLTVGTEYSFVMTATSPAGTSQESAPVKATPVAVDVDDSGDTPDDSDGGPDEGTGGTGGPGGDDGTGGSGGTGGDDGTGGSGGDSGDDSGNDSGNDSGDDSGRPSIMSSFPEAQATNVARTAGVSMTLSSEVQGVNRRTVTLLRPNGSRIPARVSYDADSHQIDVEPRGRLPLNRVVRVVLDGVRDVDGDAVPRTVWRFRTVDDAKPRIVKARPITKGGIRPGASIRMWTNERVKGVNRKAVVLREVGGKRVAATVVYRAKQRVLVIDPHRRLDRKTRYVVVLRPKVQDMAGNRMTRKIWRFHTR